MSLNAKRFADVPDHSQIRQDRRDDEKQLVEEYNRKVAIKVPDGITCVTLENQDHPDIIALRRFGRGFVGMKGQLVSLATGMEMGEALKRTRNEYFPRKNYNTVLKEIRSLATDSDMQSREDEFLDKAGPYYLRDFYKWSDKVFEIFRPKDTTNLRWDTIDQCLDSIREEYLGLISEPLRALHPGEEASKVNDDASTGWPFYTTDWYSPVDFDGGSTAPIVWGREQASRMVDTGDFSLLDNAYYALFTRKGTRGRTDTTDIKATERPVQCSSLIERFLGTGVQKPLANLQRIHPYSQGHNGVWRMGKPIQEAFAKYDTAFEADYSGFDASIMNPVVRRIFERVIIPVFDPKDHPRIIALMEHYLSAKLWTPVGLISSEHVGLMSGSMLTNVIGMIYGQMAWKYFLTRLREDESVELDCTSLGYSDDLAAFFNVPDQWEGPSDIVPRFAKYTAELNLVVHPDKQGVWHGHNKQMSFLGCIFFPDRVDENGCQPVYPMMRSTSKMLWNEFLHGGNASSGELHFNYLTDELTFAEKRLAGVIGRIDVMKFNKGFRAYVTYLREELGITVSQCRNFLPDPSRSPSLSIIAELEAEHGVPVNAQRIITKQDKEYEPLSEIELDEYECLIREANATGDQTLIRLIRDHKRQMAADLRELRKKERKMAAKREVEKARAEEQRLNGNHQDHGGGDMSTQKQGLAPALEESEILEMRTLALTGSPRKVRVFLDTLRDLLASRTSLSDSRDDLNVYDGGEDLPCDRESPSEASVDYGIDD